MAGFDGLNTDATNVWQTHIPSSMPANFSETMITTSMKTALATWIDDNGMPAYTAPPSANAGNAGMHGRTGGGGEGNGVMGLGGLGVVTMLIMVYSLCSALGLGLMWWKGVIDWKGNTIRQIANITLNDADGNSTTITVTVTDNSGIEWYVPLAWIHYAVQRLIEHNKANNRTRGGTPTADNEANVADVTFELESDDGDTGYVRLGDALDAATEAVGSHDTDPS